MRRLMLFALLSLGACGHDKSAPPPPPATGSSSSGSGVAAETPPGPGSAVPAGSGSAAQPPAATDEAAQVAALVVGDVGSKALGSQTIEASCVSVTLMPAGEWTVAAAKLKNCGDKTARSILWLYKGKGGSWSEDYVGQPPRCWQGVPADIAPAVTAATKIPSC